MIVALCSCWVSVRLWIVQTLQLRSLNKYFRLLKTELPPFAQEPVYHDGDNGLTRLLISFRFVLLFWSKAAKNLWAIIVFVMWLLVLPFSPSSRRFVRTNRTVQYIMIAVLVSKLVEIYIERGPMWSIGRALRLAEYRADKQLFENSLSPTMKVEQALRRLDCRLVLEYLTNEDMFIDLLARIPKMTPPQRRAILEAVEECLTKWYDREKITPLVLPRQEWQQGLRREPDAIEAIYRKSELLYKALQQENDDANEENP